MQHSDLVGMGTAQSGMEMAKFVSCYHEMRIVERKECVGMDSNRPVYL